MFEIERKRAILVKVPANCGGLSKRKGQEEAPEAIMREFDELFLTENFDELKFDINEIKVDNSNIDSVHKSIELDSKEILNEAKIKNLKTLFIGGDHSITYSLFKAFSKVYTKNNALVVFDAHLDLEDSKITHEDYLRNIIKDNLIEQKNVFVAGVRNVSKNERNFANKTKLNIFLMKDIFSKGIIHFASQLHSVLNGFDNIYLSIDIDCIDPGFAPGTGYMEPGGFTSREFLHVLNKIKGLEKSEQNKIKAVDIVEVNPKKDINNLTTKLAAKIISESV